MSLSLYHFIVTEPASRLPMSGSVLGKTACSTTYCNMDSNHMRYINIIKYIYIYYTKDIYINITKWRKAEGITKMWVQINDNKCKLYRYTLDWFAPVPWWYILWVVPNLVQSIVTSNPSTIGSGTYWHLHLIPGHLIPCLGTEWLGVSLCFTCRMAHGNTGPAKLIGQMGTSSMFRWALGRVPGFDKYVTMDEPIPRCN